MNDYYIRCKQSDKDTLLALAVEMGVLQSTEQGHVPASANEAWYEIGALYENEQVAADENGEPYWHANLRTTYDLMERAQQVYAEKPTPTLAHGLANIGKFFFVNEEGRASAPASPAVVFL